MDPPEDIPQATVSALVDGPERIRQAAVSLALKRNSQVTFERALKLLEADVRQAIGDEMTQLSQDQFDAGMRPKPRYSNAEARDAELQKRLVANVDAVRLVAKLDSLGQEITRANIDLEYEVNRFRGAQAIARILGGT